MRFLRICLKSWGQSSMRYKLKEIIDFKPGYAFKTKQMGEKGLNLIKIKTLKENKIIFDSNNTKIEEMEGLKNYLVYKDDIVMALTGDPVNKGNYETWVGRTCRYTNAHKAYLNQRICKLIPNENIINKLYLYYWLIRYEKTYEIASLCHGSANQANISHKDVGELTIELPNMETQNKIVKILNNLDQKIELNNQMSNNLYEILETIYKNKLEIADNENFKTLDEYCNIFTGKRNANEFDKNGENKFFTCGEKILKINSYIYDGAAIIISGNGAYTGRTIFYNGKFDLYQRTYACTPKNDELLDYIYSLYIIIKEELTDKIKGGIHGSAIPYIVMNDLAKFKVVYSDESMKRLSFQAKVILSKIFQNEIENNNLEQLRNTLLPKLINGEIDLDKIAI